MKKTTLFLIFASFFYITFAQVNSETDTVSSHIKVEELLNDGPYVFINDKDLIEKAIVDGQVVEKKLAKNAFPIKFMAQPSTFKNIEKIAALSDIHGQYDLALEILKNNGIINDELHWNFGNGHFVIVGDIFDRGDKTTEMLWFIYNLELEAQAAGGKVHYLLGNHEYMVMQGDVRYIHPKYQETVELLQTPYQNLYGPDTVLGRWLRSKPTVVKINKDVFVHGGISKDFLAMPFKIDKINKSMITGIDVERDSLQPSISYDAYFNDKGPIWYRGYFYDNLPEEEVVEILKLMKSDHVIVGHCSNEEVVQLFDNKIFGVDSSIKNGENGEILFIRNGHYSKGNKNGEVIEFD